MLKKCLLAIAVWYFVLSYRGITQVGPFTTEAGCENYRAEATSTLSCDGCAISTVGLLQHQASESA
jgi:hypothetical protein